MDQALLADVVARLDADGSLEPQVAVLALAGLMGEVDACLGGAKPRRPDGGVHEATPPVEAYVGSIAVEGFRGIGEPARLELATGPGLTLVVGRNGCGKSSFAEALELLLTGESQRWSARRSKLWREGWRNLHQPSSTRIEATLHIAGQPGPTTLSRHWGPDDPLDGGTAILKRSGLPDATAEVLGWSQPLATYRPFLSYNELGSLLEDGPSKLFDALASILGLEDLVEAAARLDRARLEREAAHKATATALSGLLAALARVELDPRAARCREALAGKRWDLEAVAELAAGASAEGDGAIDELRALAGLVAPAAEPVRAAVAALEEAERGVAALAGTDAERARRLGDLLERALELHARHGDADCPVCGRADALAPPWQEEARSQVASLRREATAADEAHKLLKEAERRARALVSAAPPALARAGGLPFDIAPLAEAWSAWAALARADRVTLLAELATRAEAVATLAGAVRERAAAELAEREAAWRPLALELSAWLPGAHRAVSGRELVKELKAAARWLTETATSIRNDRFAPIASRVKSIWELLRARSSVDLDAISFAGTGTRRHIELGVTVDGTQGAAIGVMSQGELHALALSLFLPRATLGASPFRFLVIDDPVQAMDPARVDGLARLLSEVARDRQVIVLTHDDRLWEAVRRQQIAARVIEVERRDQSRVSAAMVKDAVGRSIDDALAVMRTAELPDEVVRRVVPGLCRDALEAACLEVVRRRRIGRGEPHREVEELLEQQKRLVQKLALAIHDDAERAKDVLATLNKRFGSRAADVVQACNRGSHEGLKSGDDEFVRDTERLALSLLKL